VAYETLLQAQAPWRVQVPFVDELATLIGEIPAGARVLRDHQRLLSLIKGVAILRHAHRERAQDGSLLATLSDYAAVYDLAGETYLASATGAGKRIKETVAAVRSLCEQSEQPVTITAVAASLHLSHTAARWRVQSALQTGWLINRAKVEHRYDLAAADETGDAPSAMPTPDALAEKIACQSKGTVTKDGLLDDVQRLYPTVSTSDVAMPPANRWETWPSAVATEKPPNSDVAAPAAPP
jgi:hypothetical protein